MLNIFKNKNSKKTVAVAVSGGVDSSVTALMLKKKGYKVIGVFMRLGIDSQKAEDAARSVCQKLEIPFYPINIETDFKKQVVEYFVTSYEAGLTPNPCIKCNKLIKFGKLLQRARELGADFLATGHYVMKSKSLRMYRSRDDNKDQTYFLYNLNQDLLKHILFPLGKYRKSKIKKIASKNNLPNLKSESQDVCFLNIQGRPIEHNDFLKEHIKLKSGPIKHLLPLLEKEVERKLKTIGEHKGLPLYTIGQRKGVEVGGIGPFYVASMDYKTNILYVVQDRDDEILYSDQAKIEKVNWISDQIPKYPFECEAVIRYRHKPAQCVLSASSKNKNHIIVKFNKPQRAVTHGQGMAFYNKDELLGGGIIL